MSLMLTQSADDKSFISVQLEPFQPSTLVCSPDAKPPQKSADELAAPKPAPCRLVVFVSATSVQDDPSHSSTAL